MWDYCVACGRAAGSVHHVVQRGSPHFGDDVLENLVTLCGDGTTGCHGAWHGSPYWFVIGRGRATTVPAATVDWPRDAPAEYRERRDQEWVGKRVGQHLLRDRPDVIGYVLRKLGTDPGVEFLYRHYRIKRREVSYRPPRET